MPFFFCTCSPGEDFFRQADANEFRLYMRCLLPVLLVRAGARLSALCTVRAVAHGSASLITARFSTPLLLKAGVVLFLAPSAALLFLTAVAAVLSRGSELGGAGANAPLGGFHVGARVGFPRQVPPEPT
jgi:hypothetical protein